MPKNSFVRPCTSVALVLIVLAQPRLAHGAARGHSWLQLRFTYGEFTAKSVATASRSLP